MCMLYQTYLLATGLFITCPCARVDLCVHSPDPLLWLLIGHNISILLSVEDTTSALNKWH